MRVRERVLDRRAVQYAELDSLGLAVHCVDIVREQLSDGAHDGMCELFLRAELVDVIYKYELRVTVPDGDVQWLVDDNG